MQWAKRAETIELRQAGCCDGSRKRGRSRCCDPTARKPKVIARRCARVQTWLDRAPAARVVSEGVPGGAQAEIMKGGGGNDEKWFDFVAGSTFPIGFFCIES